MDKNESGEGADGPNPRVLLAVTENGNQSASNVEFPQDLARAAPAHTRAR